MNPSLIRKLLLTMLRIRRAEEKIVAVYGDQTMRTPTHLSIGQEAVATGVCLALKRDDEVFASHRSHAAYLAKGGSLEGFFAELCGRKSGACHGRAGSAHLTDTNVKIFSSPILSGMIPVAVGAALSFKMDKKKNVSVAFFGDAAIEEGVFAESVNFAVIKKLPVLFVCENNLYSTQSPLKVRQPASPIFKRVATPELKTKQIDGNDVRVVYKHAHEAVEKLRKGQGPLFLECLTYRIREHVGPLFDYDRGYRSKREVEAWMKKCPVKRLEKYVVAKKIMASGQIDAAVKDISGEVDAAYAKALNSPWPEGEILLEDVY
jgi:TPP-dependent pyruvate/acetoin dehydrogenase alpha subunit